MRLGARNKSCRGVSCAEEHFSGEWRILVDKPCGHFRLSNRREVITMAKKAKKKATKKKATKKKK